MLVRIYVYGNANTVGIDTRFGNGFTRHHGAFTFHELVSKLGSTNGVKAIEFIYL